MAEQAESQVTQLIQAAQAGGKEKERLMDALGSAYDIIERMLA